MTREQRQLRLARRQAMLAMLGEREAMRSLASAIAEETRSAALKARSAELVRTYTQRLIGSNPPTNAGDLAGLNQFAQALGELASDAQKAHADVLDQARWQADALARARSRARRLSERADQAQARIDAAQLSREATAEGLARELHKHGQVKPAERVRDQPPGLQRG